jgi:hypothetical protein
MQNCLGSSSAPRWFTGPCKEQHGRQTAPLSYRTKHTFPRRSLISAVSIMQSIRWLVYLTWTTIARFEGDISARPARPGINLSRRRPYEIAAYLQQPSNVDCFSIYDVSECVRLDG